MAHTRHSPCLHGSNRTIALLRCSAMHTGHSISGLVIARASAELGADPAAADTVSAAVTWGGAVQSADGAAAVAAKLQLAAVGAAAIVYAAASTR